MLVLARLVDRSSPVLVLGCVECVVLIASDREVRRVAGVVVDVAWWICEVLVVIGEALGA